MNICVLYQLLYCPHMPWYLSALNTFFRLVLNDMTKIHENIFFSSLLLAHFC